MRRSRLKALRRHRVFVSMMIAAIVLRVIVTLAYGPALFFPDSGDYLQQAHRLQPGAWHPIGYALFLHLILWVHDVAVVPVAQHLVVLVDAGILYALLYRLGVTPWLAAAGCAPLLFDAYQLDIEQYVLSEAAFETAITVAFAVLLWRRTPSLSRIAVAGALLAFTAVIRFDGVILIVPAIAYLLVRRAGWRRIVTCAVAFVVPLVAYASWYDAVNGQFTFSGLSGLFLYERVASFAECQNLQLPPQERALCPAGEPSTRLGVLAIALAPDSAMNRLRRSDPATFNSILERFDTTIITHQPLDYADHVLSDYFRQFLPTHVDPSSINESETQFQIGYPGKAVTDIANPVPYIALAGGGPGPSANVALDRFLRDYQSVFYTWGPLVLAFIVVSLVATCGLGSARQSGRRAECGALVSGGILLFFASVAGTLFGWRYQLPTLVLLPPAAALALAMLVPRLRNPDVWTRRVSRRRRVPSGATPHPVLQES